MSTAAPPTFARLPAPARGFIVGVVLVAATAVAVASAAAAPPSGLDVTLLFVCAAACAAANLFEVFAPGHFSLQPNLVPFVAGAALLPGEWLPVLAIASFLPGWVVKRTPWFMPLFNVANYALAGAALNIVVASGDAFREDRKSVV